MDGAEKLLDNYAYIVKIVKYKAANYDLDFDGLLNYILEKLSAKDYAAIRSYRGDSKFTTFLTVVVNNMIYRYAGRQKRDLPDVSCIQPDTPLDHLLRQQEMEYRNIFIHALPGLLRELGYQEKIAVELRYLKGIKIGGIAKILGISRYTTKKKLEMALCTLRRKLTDMCKN